MPEYSIDLSVPSGKLVFANDLRDLFEGEYEEEDLRPSSRGWGFDVCTELGCRQVFEAYGRLGMAHGFVGNTCPGVYRRNKDTLTISTKGSKKQHVGGICTDLWWYSIVDYDDYVRRVGASPPKVWSISVVNVEPGTYRVTQRAHLFDHDTVKTEHYAIIRRVGDHTGLKERTPLSPISVEDAIMGNIIFGGIGNRASALDYLFFTIGTGTRWMNGCIMGNMNPRKLLDNLPNSWIKVPTDIERRMRDTRLVSIYPISSYSKICSVPDNVQPDWLAAAHEALDIVMRLDPNVVHDSGYKNSNMIAEAKRIRADLDERFGPRE
jgi:hypothetical protein